MNLSYWLNTAWMWTCRREAHAFRRATFTVAETQAAVLQEILTRNRHSEFGRVHGFGSIRSPDDFQCRVPRSTADAYTESIQRIADGESKVLTAERVLLLEPTSGTTGGEKLIPYTPLLRRQFQRAVATWIADLMQHRPAVRHGRAYWSISPALGRTRRTKGGIPIGFDDDTAYLGRLEQVLLNRLLAVPSAVAKSPDIENFRYCTLRYLLQAGDLAFMSVWSPTFLTTLLRSLTHWSERICSDLRRGCLTLPNPEAARIPERLLRQTNLDVRRAAELEAVFASASCPAECLQRIWPHLAIISCWTDAATARYLPELLRLFPSVEIQPKGLLATEGCVSFPLVGRQGAALALRSHFFEFEECDDVSSASASAERLCLAHELQQGRRYQVVLTTGGGLYRYRLGDMVQVIGWENRCPLLRFQGRFDRVNDLVGEKLSEPHVREVLDRVFAAHGISPCFAMVVPVDDAVAHYRLCVQYASFDRDRDVVASLAASIQCGLEQNPHYRHAIALGQLAPLDVHVIDESAAPAWDVYERECVARGQKPGDVKPTALASRPSKIAQIG